MRANLIFREMREKRDYFAVVLDEYGCFVGIVTLHDLVETLVGDIDDRTDLPKPDDIEKTGEHIWKIQGGAILDDVAEVINVELPVEKYDTFSGFVCGVLERVPEDGEQFRCSWKNLDIVVNQVRCSAREKSAGTERRDLTKPCSARSWDSYREKDLRGFMDIFEHVVA